MAFFTVKMSLLRILTLLWYTMRDDVPADTSDSSGSAMKHVLVVEDEPNLLLLLTRLLAGQGYQVTGRSSGREALRAAAGAYDLMILDLMLPDMSGETVLHDVLAGNPNAKVLVLSSVTDLARRVGVLDHGAVDFLAKPFAGAELLARVRARIRQEDQNVAGSVQRYLTGAGLHLDLERHELMVNGRRIDLSQREFAVLAYLLRRTPAVCTRAELLSDVWGLGFDPGSNVIDVYMRRLRVKLTISRIETVRNVGYRLVAC